MTSTKGFSQKRPQSNRHYETEARCGNFEEVARATQATHKSDLAAEEVDQMHFNASQFAP